MPDITKNSPGAELYDHPIMLFDGICNLCNASVQWVLLHDPAGIFHFAALQSDAGQQLLERHGLATQNFDSVVLLDGEKVLLRSDVSLEIVRRLGGGWRLLYIFKLVPRPLRDAVYTWIAKNRYKWWGHRESCMLPKPAWKERFIG